MLEARRNLLRHHPKSSIMKFASFAALFAGCVVLVAAQDNSVAAVEAAFRNAKVSTLVAAAMRFLSLTSYQIPGDLHINFRPTELLEVTFPQTSSRSITLHAGVQLPRNGKYKNTATLAALS